MSLTAVVWLAGCDCGGTLGSPCEGDSDCAATQICVDGRCTSRPDTGRADGSSCVDRDGDGLCVPADCDDTDRQRGGPEVCDDVDNDCDGAIDEDISDICRDCAPGCTPHPFPGPGGWMPTEENSSGVIVDDDGAITLGRTETTAFAVWVANMNEGTVSKLDSRTGNEIALYPTVGAGAPAGTRPWSEACDWSTLGNCPSRTAVDQNFDAYVANRAFGNQGSVTKYANTESDCVDRNASGMIETSRDLNADGRINRDPAAGEFIGPDDECILWTAAVGGINGVPRALSLGLAPPDGLIGDVWVGAFNERTAYRLSPATGAVIASVSIAPFASYGFAADSAGRIWAVDRSNEGRREVLGYIDTFAMTFSPVTGMPDVGGTCAIPYGITVDGAGDVFLANQCDPSIWRYRPSAADPRVGEWTAVDGGGAAFVGTPRGVAADETHLWVALSHEGDQFTVGGTNRVRQYRLSDLSFVAEHRTPGLTPIGIGVSFDGSVWAINQDSSSAARLDPTTGAWTEHPVGLNPYTYSDFIGFGLNVFAEPRGHYRFVVEGCDEQGGSFVNRWTGARYVAEVPSGTTVQLYVRVAATREALAALTDADWIGPFEGNPVSFDNPPGPLPTGRYIEVDVRLATSDRTIAPRVFSVDIAGVCEESLM